MSLKQNYEVVERPLEASSPGEPATSSRTRALVTYQILVGDVDAPLTESNKHDIFHSLRTAERRARIWILVSGAAFAILLATQVILCVGIAVGAQEGLDKNTISILAAINTGVAASIAGLKAMGLPETKLSERYQLQKILEEIYYTTRKLRAGVTVEVEQEAENVRKMGEAAETAGQIKLPTKSATTCSKSESPSDTLLTSLKV